MMIMNMIMIMIKTLISWRVQSLRSSTLHSTNPAFRLLGKRLTLSRSQNKGLSGLEIKKILRSPFGDQLEKYSHQMQIFSRQFESCK